MKPPLDGHKLKVRFHSLTFKHPVKARLLIGVGAPFELGTVAPGTSPGAKWLRLLWYYELFGFGD
jgi:hypothetical protein